nr:hypothetical protein [uncultured Pantoea sp.]
MKFLNIKTSAAAAIIIAGISSHAAIATVSEASTTSADITFTTPLTVSNVLTPVSGLSDGTNSGKVLANGTITSTGGASRHYIAFGMPGSLTGSDNGKTQATLRIKGKNDSNNGILVTIIRPANTPDSVGSAHCSELNLTCNTDYILYSTATNGVSTYNVTLSGTQDVKPDTYTVQTTAYAYGD